ncbi:hypothetical protein R0J92_15685 [Tritonibacter sp. SIMBA_163]
MLGIGQRQEWADQVPKGEDGLQLCSGGFLRFAASGADRSISQGRHRLLNGGFRESARARSSAFAAPCMNVVIGLLASSGSLNVVRIRCTLAAAPPQVGLEPIFANLS